MHYNSLKSDKLGLQLKTPASLLVRKGNILENYQGNVISEAVCNQYGACHWLQVFRTYVRGVIS